MTERQQALLLLIEDAFRDVELGDGVSLHETVVIDDYGGPEQRQAARAPDEKHDWRKLIDDPELAEVRGMGGMCFYDAPGLRFHLPAYLSLAVKDANRYEVVNDLYWVLICLDEYNRERLSVLDDSQRRCVWEVLKYLSAQDEDWELDQDLENYWNPRGLA